MYIKLIRVFTLAFLSVLPALAISADNADVLDLYHSSAVVMKGRIVEVEGTCSAIGCGDVNYGVETYKLYIDRDHPEIRYSDIIKIDICAKSGLDLGSKYIFFLKNSNEIRKESLLLHGELTTLPCQYHAPKGSIFAEIDDSHHYRIQTSKSILGSAGSIGDFLVAGKIEPSFEKDFLQAIESEPEEKQRAIDRSNPPKKKDDKSSSP